MKKIIATVLAMVMALALCTVAFADDTVTTVETAGKETFYLKNNEFYTDADCTKLVTAAVKANLLATAVTDAQSVTKYGQYNTVAPKLYKSAAAVTCTADGWKVNLYIDKNGGFYVKVSEKEAYETANKTTITVINPYFFGSSIDNIEKYESVAEASVKVAAGHLIIKTSDTYGESKAPVYKCVLCGATYVKDGTLTKDADKNAVAKFDRISYTKVNDADARDILFAKDYLNATQADTYTYIQLKAGTTTGTTTDKNTSPKTFDAGIAMYVGMALTSVAGSAVVIGKKKEF